MMTQFKFDVDDAYARKHNEFLRDARRMQWSAGILALILFAVIGVTFSVAGVQLISIAVAISLGFFAILSLIMIPILPMKMGSPQHYFDMYDLAPAIIAEVNPRDLVLMMLVDASADASVKVPALALRTVTSIPGVAREVGAKVPSMAVTGFRPTRGPKVYEEISPMPVAWGTPDSEVWRKAERAIPTNQWKRLEGLLDRLEDVKKTRREVLILDES